MARVRSIAIGLATVGVLAAGTNLLGQQHGGGGSTPAGGEAKETRVVTITKVYAVPDLVVGPKYDMNPLIDLLASSVAPGTWRIVGRDGQATREGGPGMIEPIQ